MRFNEYFLDSKLVDANIEKIKFYLDDENTNLEEECNSFKKCLEKYKSDKNTSLMMEKIEEFQNTLDSILTKRRKYVDILNIEKIRYSKIIDKQVETLNNVNYKFDIGKE